MSTPPTTLIFLHIPKTGGTTFRRILEQNYSRAETLTFTGPDHRVEIEQFAKSSESARSRYRLVQGHFYFGVHRFIPGESSYMTWMRDPIARVLSFYSHARTHSEHYLHRRLIEERLDLKKLLERNETPELSNLQTRMIAGIPIDPNVPVDRYALETAKKNLSSDLMFVGLAEEFDASLVLFCQRRGWDVPCYKRTNVTREKIDLLSIDPQASGMLREANSLDLELHEFARTLFGAKRRFAGSAFEERLARFQRLNSVYALSQRKGVVMKNKLKNFLGIRENSAPAAALKGRSAGPSI
jgi:hypothetical protein